MARVYADRGLAFWDKDDYDKAIADYTTAIRLDPKCGGLLQPWGRAGRQRRNPSGPCRLRGSHPAEAEVRRGVSLSRRRLHARASTTRRSPMAPRPFGSTPRNASAYANRGSAYVSKGEYDLAIADFSVAIRHDPKLATAYWGRGAAYEEKGELVKAIADLTEAVRLDPNCGRRLCQAGLRLPQHGQSRKGDRRLQRGHLR